GAARTAAADAPPKCQNTSTQREAEPVASLLAKAIVDLGRTGQRHNSTVRVAAQLRDNRHSFAEAEDAVRALAQHFPSKPGDPYGEAEALATLADVWTRSPARNPSGPRRKSSSGTPALDLPLPPPASRCPRAFTRLYVSPDNPTQKGLRRDACGRTTCPVCSI